MSKVKVAAVSDLHGNLDFEIPQCDLLAIAGDVCPASGGHGIERQRMWLERSFFPWCEHAMSRGRVGRIVMTAGNHDNVFRRAAELTFPEGVTFLMDSEAELCGLRVYGTPWTPVFMNWHFMASEDTLRRRFSSIPAGLDLLISHGPAFGACDVVLRPAWTGDAAEPLGSKALAEAVARAKPKWHVFGHVHTGSHEPQSVGDTMAVNVSLIDERYDAAYPVRVIEFETGGSACE